MVLETNDQNKVIQFDRAGEEQPALKEMLNNVFSSGDLVERNSEYHIVVGTMPVAPGQIHLSGRQRILYLDKWGQVSSWVSADIFSLTEGPEKREDFLLQLANHWGVDVSGLPKKWAEIAKERYYVDTHPFG